MPPGMPLNHIKPHGSLYGVSAIEDEVAHGIADAAEIFNVGVFGMVNTCHEKIYKDEKKSNSNIYPDDNLSDSAMKNLVNWYSLDFEFYKYCKQNNF